MSRHGVSHVNVTVNDIRKMAAHYGITVETFAPGDGVRRFQFYKDNPEGRGGRRLYTASGIGEALVFVEGVRVGSELARGENPRESRTHQKNPREQFYDTQEDVDWLFDTHLDHEFTREYRDETRSFVLYGNEDSPDAVILFTTDQPRIGQKGMKVRIVDGEVESVYSVRYQ